MDALGWGAVALGAVALVATVVLLRRLSRTEPDFSPTYPATTTDAGMAAVAPPVSDADAAKREP